MISADDVYAVFLTLISPESIEGTDKALSLCYSSLEKLKRVLRSDIDFSDPRIAYAAACDAYYSYCLSFMTDVEENSDFSAGDMSVRRKVKETLEVAQRLKDDGASSIRELMKDTAFGAWSV